MNSKLKAIRKENGSIIAWLEDSNTTILMPTVTNPKSYTSSFSRYSGESVDIEKEHVFLYHLPKEFRE